MAPPRGDEINQNDPGLQARLALAGVHLLPGEEVLHEAEFTPHRFFPHKSYVVMTSKRIVIRHPNTVFRIFVAGYFISSTPLSKVEQVNAGAAYRDGTIAMGVGAIVMSVLMLFFAFLAPMTAGMNVFMAIVGVIAGIVLISVSRNQGLFINTGGGTMSALGRASELPEVEFTAKTMVSLMLDVEENRSVRA